MFKPTTPIGTLALEVGSLTIKSEIILLRNKLFYYHNEINYFTEKYTAQMLLAGFH